MKSQKNNYSRKNKKTKKNVKINIRSRKMMGGTLNDIINKIIDEGLIKKTCIINSIQILQLYFRSAHNKSTNLIDQSSNTGRNYVQEIGKVIKKNKKITKLIINNCNLNIYNALSLIEELQDSNVTSIDLSNNNLKAESESEKECLESLKKIIINYKKLTYLNLFNNPIIPIPSINKDVIDIISIINERA